MTRRDLFTWTVIIKAYVSVSPTLLATDVMNVDLHITESTLVGTQSLSRNILQSDKCLNVSCYAHDIFLSLIFFQVMDVNPALVISIIHKIRHVKTVDNVTARLASEGRIAMRVEMGTPF